MFKKLLSVLLALLYDCIGNQDEWEGGITSKEVPMLSTLGFAIV